MEIQKVEEYEQLSDEELLELLHKGREGLEDYLIDKYKGMVLKKAHAMYLMGGEPEDLIQEGMIGLFKAVRGYRPDKNASFSTFANLCVERQMYKAIEISGRQKHRPLNSYISLSEEDSPLKNAEDTVWQNPEDIVIGQESANHMLEEIQGKLSPFENQVLEAYLAGADYVQIARQMEREPKSIDNAFQRIRNKIHGMKLH